MPMRVFGSKRAFNFKRSVYATTLSEIENTLMLNGGGGDYRDVANERAAS